MIETWQLQAADQLRSGTRHDARNMCLLVSLYANNLSLMPVLSSRSGGLDRAFFVRAAHHVTSIMKRTPSTLTLRIDALGPGELLHLRRLLVRLARPSAAAYRSCCTSGY